MPHRVTKTRLMRRPSINANPPICRSKYVTQCELKFFDCATGATLSAASYSGLTLAQCEAHKTDIAPAYGYMQFYDPQTHLYAKESFRVCTFWWCCTGPYGWWCVTQAGTPPTPPQFWCVSQPPEPPPTPPQFWCVSQAP